MPKHTIEFQLPEERSELEVTLAAHRLHGAISEMLEWLRGKVKHGEMAESDRKLLEEVKLKLWKFLEENEVNPLF